MRYGLLLALGCLASLSGAVKSDTVYVSLGVSRSGLNTQSKVEVKAFDARGTFLGSGVGRFNTEITPGHSAQVQVKLDHEIDTATTREIGVEVTPAGGQTAQINRLTCYLGSSYPRLRIVDNRFSPTSNGHYDRYRVEPKDERAERFDSIQFTGSVADGAELRTEVQFLIELTNGKTYVAPAGQAIRKNDNFDVTLALPEPVYRGEIKRFRIYAGRSSVFHIMSFDQLFYETDDIKLNNVRFSGFSGGAHYPIADLQTINLRDSRLYESPDLSGGLATRTAKFTPRWFNVHIYTGSDDLRWDPEVQPNMEIQVSIYIKGISTPIPIAGRWLNPYAKFAEGGVFGGSFKGLDIAERIAPWRDSGRAPRIQDIEAVEVETIPGWDGSTPSHKILRGQGDPFRQPDTWSFRGIWFGVSTELPTIGQGNIQVLSPWTTILTDFSTVHRMKVGQKVRFPVKVVEGLQFNPSMLDNLTKPNL